ncbi:MAG: TIGR03936 family radical SAM-associated protein [Clostridiales bacterium]|nr:TIGR03936 family radical SAM-associated protein [Clostridiales bacterium]
MRTLVKYAKTDAAIYVSHLDTQRTIQRVLRRTRLPIKYTMGFHPHPILTFAQPLSVGVSSKGDYFEFSMLEHIEPMRLKGIIASAMPKGFVCLDCGYIRDEFPSLMAMVRRAEWDLTIEDLHIDKANILLNELLSKQSVIVEKSTKRGVKEVDIRPGVALAECESTKGGTMFKVVLATGSKGNVSPRHFLKAMGIDYRYAMYNRIDIFYEKNGIHFPLINSTRMV